MKKFADDKIYTKLNNELNKLKTRESLFDLALYKSIDKKYADFGNIPTIYLLVSNAILSFVFEFWLFEEEKEDNVINKKYIIEMYAFNDSSVDIFKEFSDGNDWKGFAQLRQISIDTAEHKGANNVLLFNKGSTENDDKYVNKICEVVWNVIGFMGKKVKTSKDYKNYDFKKCIKGKLFKDSLLFCGGQVQKSFYEELKARSIDRHKDLLIKRLLKYMKHLFSECNEEELKAGSIDRYKDLLIKRLLRYNKNLFYEWNEEEFMKKFIDALNLFILDDIKLCTEIMNSTEEISKNNDVICRLRNKFKENKMDVQKLNRLLLELLYADKVTKRYYCCLYCPIVNECMVR